MDYPKGAMGIHFVNPGSDLVRPDPTRPNVLIYEPVGKSLRLVVVEWLVPLATAEENGPACSANLSTVRWRDTNR